MSQPPDSHRLAEVLLEPPALRLTISSPEAPAGVPGAEVPLQWRRLLRHLAERHTRERRYRGQGEPRGPVEYLPCLRVQYCHSRTIRSPPRPMIKLPVSPGVAG